MLTYTAWRTERSCLDKRYYHTREDARRAKRRMKRRHGGVYTAYRCRHCGGWHLTSQERGKYT